MERVLLFPATKKELKLSLFPNYLAKKLRMKIVTLDTCERVESSCNLFASVSFEHQYPHLLSLLERVAGRVERALRLGGICMLNPYPLYHVIKRAYIGDFYPEEIEQDCESIFIPGERERVVVRQRKIDEPIYFLNERKELLIEIQRGCRNRCLFCMLSWNRRFSYADVESVKSIVSSCSPKRVVLIGSDVLSHPDIAEIAAFLRKKDIDFSMPSFRADVLLEMKEIMKLVPGRFVTIAPETGEKLRFLLGKRFTDDEIVEIVECAKRYGIKAVKLYFMIGLPFERVEEIKEIVDKVKRVGVKVYASFSIFVPKPHTPLQFSKLNTVEELERKNAFIRKNLRVSKLHLTNPKRAILQAVLSIGGIDVANALLKVYTNGLNFSVWKKHVCIDKYLEEKIDWDFEFENIKSMVERKTLEKIYVKFKKKATDTLSTCSHTSCT